MSENLDEQPFDDEEDVAPDIGDDDDTRPIDAVATEPAPSAAQQALRAALVEFRDDVASWAVLADVLQSENDPRGALVALMLERERAPSQRLYDSELAYRKQHGKQLLPAFLRKDDSVAWRRGFPVAIPIKSAADLQRAIKSPSLAFVESVRCLIAIEDWQDWGDALEGKQLPWRRVRLEIGGASEDDEIALAAWLAVLPALERFDVAFPQYEEARVVFTDVVAPRLKTLSIENAVEVDGIEDAELPVLEEVFVLGSTPLDTIPGVTMRRGRATDEDDDYGNRQDAFIVVRQLVDASLVEEVAHTSLASFTQFVVETGHVVSGPFTVIRVQGRGPTELMPYGFAVALERVLAPNTPIVLFHSSEATYTARAFALGARPFRRTDGDERGGALLRTMFDILVGVDPGPDLLDDLTVALSCSTQVSRGTALGIDVPTLFDIDPGSMGPLPEIDDPDFYDGELPQDYEVELYTPGAEQVVVAAETAEVAESPPLVETLAELEGEREEDFIFVDTDDDEDDDETPEGRDAWMRLLAEWSARTADPDDDYAERWVDPEVHLNEYWEGPRDFESLPGDHACQDCEQARVMLYPCTWCGGQHCGVCSAQRADTIWCIGCIHELTKDLDAAVAAAPQEVTYNDEVFDGELAPPELVFEAELEDERAEFDDWA